MLMLRYWMLLLLFQLVTFYKQKPWHFLLGIVLWPYHFISRWMLPTEKHPLMVANGIQVLAVMWVLDEVVAPPHFVQKRFLRLQEDAFKQLGV
jgi:hypothetical protein